MKKFIIDHIDPLGQGVFKEDDQIYFIPKTLPGEQGTFKTVKKKKNLNFAEIVELSTQSNKRIKPPCIHFNECPNCQFLHTTYDEELLFKTATFNRKLTSLRLDSLPQIDIIEAPTRVQYRNRVQLHYNLKTRKIGAIDSKNDQIIDIKNCQIMEPLVKEVFDQLINDQSWFTTAKSFKKVKGHVEIYNSPEGLKVSWNRRYAQGGFSQVNQLMNEKLQQKVSDLFKGGSLVLDLFGGAGNLTHNLMAKQKTIVDVYQHKGLKDKMFSLNLFDDNSLDLFLKTLPDHKYDSFIVDPPRSGFKNISTWVNHFKPEQIIYVSCHPDTMIRDIKPLLSEYTISSISLLELFPSTYHFEGIMKLERS